MQRKTELTSAASATLKEHYPGALREDEFVEKVSEELLSLGFTKDNSIAFVNTCRDEVCRPLASSIDKKYGYSFNTSGLGGLINCGKTGLQAGMHHSPQTPDADGKLRERYIFFAFPHTAVGEDGKLGSLHRRGRGSVSSACGALLAIHGTVDTPPVDDPDDAEIFLLKKKILAELQTDGITKPSLAEVNTAALKTITKDLEKLISETVHGDHADYAVVTGLQIHSGNQIEGQPFQLDRAVDLVSVGTFYAVVNGQRKDLSLPDHTKQPQAASPSQQQPKGVKGLFQSIFPGKGAQKA